MQAAQSALVTVKENPRHATSTVVGAGLAALGLYFAMHYLFADDNSIQTRHPECFTPQDTCNVTMTVLSKVCKDACNLDNADAALGIIGFTFCVAIGAVLVGLGVRGMRQAAKTDEAIPLLGSTGSTAAASVLPNPDVFQGATGAAGAQAFKKVTGAGAAGDLELSITQASQTGEAAKTNATTPSLASTTAASAPLSTARVFGGGVIAPPGTGASARPATHFEPNPFA